MGPYSHATAPMQPVPGIREMGNAYFPVQEDGKQFTYMDRVKQREALEEVKKILILTL